MIVERAKNWLENYPKSLRIRDGVHKGQIIEALAEYAAHMAEIRCDDCDRPITTSFTKDEDGRLFHHAGCGGAKFAKRMSKIPGTPEFNRLETKNSCTLTVHESTKVINQVVETKDLEA